MGTSLRSATGPLTRIGVILLSLAAMIALLPRPALAGGGSLSPAGPGAETIAGLFKAILWMALGVFLLVEGLLLYTVVRFRKRREKPPQISGNRTLEVLWTVAPILILVIVAILTVGSLGALAQPPQADLTLEVIGRQWVWEFRYPEGVTSLREMRVPVGKVVGLELTSPDVIHSFWVPELAGKMDAIPGHVNRFWIRADRPGTYRGQCAEFCGLAHAAMLIDVIAMEPAEFEAWLRGEKERATKGAPAVADAERGKGLLVQGACATCHTVRGTAAQGKVGPELTDFARREKIAGVLPNTPQDLAKWLADPGAIKPGTAMPNLHLSQPDIQDLVAYLMTLKGTP